MKTIDWSGILLYLWETGDTYKNSFVSISVERRLNSPYLVIDKSGNPKRFSSGKTAIIYLENLQAIHNEFSRGDE